MSRLINRAGLDLIKQFESCKLVAYPDVRGIWTIGWGHTGGVSQGMSCSAEEAERHLQDDLEASEVAVGNAVGRSWTSDNQFAAMVSLCFNIGARAFTRSTVARQHCIGAHFAASEAFMLWNKATINGDLVVVDGLTRRRKAERALYLT